MDIFRINKNPWVQYETEVPHSRLRDPACGVGPAEKLSPEQLQLLRNAFTCQGGGRQKSRRQGGNRTEKGEHAMSFEEFHGVLRSVIGPDVADAWVRRFFDEIDICRTGRVTWQQLCSFLLLEYAEQERSSVPRAALLDSQTQIIHCSHNKREPTVRVVAVYHPPPLRYISVSKGGQVTVWNNSLHLLKTAQLAGDPSEEVAHTRSFRGWTTDAVYMENVCVVVVSTDRGDLHFVHVGTAGVSEEVQLFGFRSVVTALCYSRDVQCPERPPLLLMGDEKGGIHLMWFLNPLKGLFNRPVKKTNGPQRIYFPDIGEHPAKVSYRYIPNIHDKSINRLLFEPLAGVIMSSSESDTTAVVSSSVARTQEPYVWKCKQGAKCFDYNEDLQLLVTGGCDQVVRLWNRFVTTRPLASLRGHSAAVLDVAIYQPVEQIFSYSRDCELRTWDVSSHRCLKAVTLQFPCRQPGRIPEHGNFPVLLLGPSGQTQPHLVVGCKDYLARIRLATRDGRRGWRLNDEATEPGSQVISGQALSCVLHNPTLRLVVTGHVDSSITLWDVDTGKRRLLISNAHGEEQLTCMTMDSSHRRLITGACNGTIKVWNLLNGLNLHKLEPVTDSDVTAVTCLPGNRLLAVGWGQRIAQYDISPAEDVYVKADMSWKPGCVRRSDISAVCQCPSLGVVATASHGGDVVVWRLETQGPVLHLRGETQTGTPPPVDALLFLQHRAGDRKRRSRGVLVSSQAGRVHFWSIGGQKQSYGHFYAAQLPGERVLCLSSDRPENTTLVSGDTAGWLHVWDISAYGLDAKEEPVCDRERPPLLRSWRAHQSRLLRVEVLEAAERQFILAASARGPAALWTKGGDHVGSFGQNLAWDVADPSTYQSVDASAVGQTTSFVSSEEACADDVQRGTHR